MRKLMDAFTDHPASVNESYFQHMGVGFRFGGRMLFAGCACLVHGLFPLLCTRTGSRTVTELHGRMVTHRTAQPPDGAVPARQ